MSQVRRVKKPQKGSQKRLRQLGEKDFSTKQTRLVLYNTLPVMPDEFDTIVPSGFIMDSATVNVSATLLLNTNSLLATSHSTGITVSQSLFLDELIRTYESYRVVAYDLKYHWVSRSTLDSNLVILHTNEDPAFSTGVFGLQGLTYPNPFHLLVPATSKSPCAGTVVCPRHSLADVVGSPTFATDDSYAGSINSTGVFTSPATLTYMVFYFGTITGAIWVANTAPYLSGTFHQYVKFYGRRA